VTRILFVDDEPLVLQGLQRMLRPYCGHWAMRFVAGGRQALAELEREPADVVVSDVRMPDIDGHTLLSQVRDRYPQTIRIILSGQTSQSTAVRSVRVAHRHLTKPCDPVILKANIEQALHLRGQLRSERLLAVVNSLEAVPSLPAVVQQLQKELDRPEASINHIAELISQDPGLTTKILQVINSALFGLRHRVDQVAQAVLLLGLDFIESLICSYHIVSQLSPAVMARFHLDETVRHGQYTSVLARRIAEREALSSHAPQRMSESLALAGMLQDVGLLLLARSLPSELEQIIEQTRRNQTPLEVAERQVLGVTHGELGGYLLALWGLPDPLVETVTWHHQPSTFPGMTSHLLSIIHIAGHLALEVLNPPGYLYPSPLDTTWLENSGLARRIPSWRSLAQDVFQVQRIDQ